MISKRYVLRKNHFILFAIILLLMTYGCGGKDGRISVILDNSGSMSSTGTSFREIKKSVRDALILIPHSYEKGLRVFDNQGGSKLISPYHRSIVPLQSKLNDIDPDGGTYIGESLLNAADDLLQKSGGDNRLILITDGEGDESDIQKAHDVKKRLAGLQGNFKCNFILFSNRKNVLTETPIGEISTILGCDLTVPDDYASAPTLTTALHRILGFDFYWLWIILSALAYFILLYLTARLIFFTQCAQGVLPYYAKMSATVLLLSVLPLVMGAHIMGLFSRLSGVLWGFVILAVSSLFIALAGLGKKISKRKDKTDDPNDPFA